MEWKHHFFYLFKTIVNIEINIYDYITILIYWKKIIIDLIMFIFKYFIK